MLGQCMSIPAPQYLQSDGAVVIVIVIVIVVVVVITIAPLPTAGWVIGRRRGMGTGGGG